MHARVKICLFSVVLMLFSIYGTSQEPPAKTKYPSIGLVLQGGGALGLAHVGVITWMEEHHIPINYIAGTSMGGLVGGVYATGHNAVEMRQIVDGIPWTR